MATAKNAKTNTTTNTNNEVSELLKQVKELTEILNKRDQAAAPPTIVIPGKKGTHIVITYTMWTKNWREEHPKQNPPAGKKVQAEPSIAKLEEWFQEEYGVEIQ